MKYNSLIYFCKEIISSPDRNIIVQKEYVDFKYAHIDAKDIGSAIGADGTVVYKDLNKITHNIYIKKDSRILYRSGSFIYRPRKKYADEWFKIIRIMELNSKLKLSCALQKQGDDDILAINVPEYQEIVMPFE